MAVTVTAGEYEGLQAIVDWSDNDRVGLLLSIFDANATAILPRLAVRETIFDG